jgi:hypothetical protein
MDKDDKKPKKVGRPKVDKKPLTPKQMKLARNIASGMPQVEAYRDAYNTTTDNKNTQRVRAYHEARKDNVAAMIADLKARAEQGVVWTRQMAVEALLEAADIARCQKHSQGMTGALKELNAMYGYNEATKINIGGQNGNPILLQKIERIVVNDDSED